MTWLTIPLSEIAHIDRDGVDASEILSGTAYVGLEDIESGGRILRSTAVKNGELASTKFRFGPEHILYGKLRPYLAKIALPEFCGICSTDILPIRPKPGTDRKFLAYFLRQPHMVEMATARAAGVNLPRLSPRLLAEFEIPLPPITEQRRIAAILDKVDAIRRKREQALAFADDLLKSTFLEMFGDPNVHKSRPDAEEIGSVCDLYAGNTLPAGEEFEEQGDGYLLLKVSDLNHRENSDVVNASKLWLPESPKIRSSLIAPKGAVVFPKRGGAIATNKKRVLGRPAVLDPNLMAVATKRGGALSEPYLRAWFGFLDLAQISNGSSVPQLNKKDIEPLKILVPPPTRVDAFDRVFARCHDIRVKVRRHMQLANQSFDALSQQAFRGEL